MNGASASACARGHTIQSHNFNIDSSFARIHNLKKKNILAGEANARADLTLPFIRFSHSVSVSTGVYVCECSFFLAIPIRG